MKTYRLVIDRWDAAIQKDWGLEVSPKDKDEYVNVAGCNVSILKDWKLRSTNEAAEQLLENMERDNLVVVEE